MFKIDERVQRMAGYWYLGQPYSHPDPQVRATRWQIGRDAMGDLLQQRIHIFSPIHATHEVSLTRELPYEHEFWIAFNKHFIDGSCGMLLLEIDGWTESRGLKQEFNYCQAIGKPVYYIHPDCTITAYPY